MPYTRMIMRCLTEFHVWACPIETSAVERIGLCLRRGESLQDGRCAKTSSTQACRDHRIVGLTVDRVNRV
jgi:hypothetical protein